MPERMRSRLLAIGASATAAAMLAAGAVSLSHDLRGPAAQWRTAADPCSLGRPLFDRQLLAPRPGTFYSVDALNPDVVARGGRYYMFFSGNRARTDAGDWRTGLAVSSSPLGPFSITGLRGNYLNGGTVVWRGRFWQARTLNRGGGELASSRDGLRWRREAVPPQRVGPYRLTADYSLETTRDGLRLWFLARRAERGELKGDVASLEWEPGRGFHRLRTALRPGPQRWSALDLGEPFAFRLRGRRYLLYTGTAPAPTVRAIGLARETEAGAWRTCGDTPAIAPGARFAPVIAIDPSAIVIGRRLYVYYGGGRTTGIASNVGGRIGVLVYDAAAAA